MATIDNLDLSIYNMYAIRTKMIEDINEEFRFQEASSIPSQLTVMNFYPQLSELDLLLGIVPLNTPWALFLPPKYLNRIRQSPFTFARIAPSLGSDKEQSDIKERIEAVNPQNEEEREEKGAVLGCLKEFKKINEWLGFIVGRIGQFLQG